MEESYRYRSFFECAGDQRTFFFMHNELIELIIGSKFTSGLKPPEELFAAIHLEEEALMLTPIDKEFPKFVKKFNVFLKEIIGNLKL